MENQTNTSKKIIINNGLYLGLILTIISGVLFAMDMHYERNWISGSLSIILMIVFIVLGFNQYKAQNNGYMKLSKALKIGVGITLVAALIGLVYQYLLVNFLDPNFVENTMALQREEIISNYPEMTDEQLDQQTEMGKKFFWISYPVILIISLFFGFVISLITGLIMKKNNEESF